MDPHERTRRFPIIKGVAFGKPRGRAMVMHFASQIVIYPWIWGRQPSAKAFLALVTYKFVSAYIPEMTVSRSYERSISFTLRANSCIKTSEQL
jgi:hypothetical protein